MYSVIDLVTDFQVVVTAGGTFEGFLVGFLGCGLVLLLCDVAFTELASLIKPLTAFIKIDFNYLITTSLLTNGGILLEGHKLGNN